MSISYLVQNYVRISVMNLTLMLLLSFSFTHADNLIDSNKLFDWAESNYPQYFSPSGTETTRVDNYLVRYYESKNIYLGTLGEDVYVHGDEFGGLFKVGTISDFISTCTDLSGQWLMIMHLKCNDNPDYDQLEVFDSGPITQNECKATFTGVEGDTFQGDVVENTLNFTANYYVSEFSVNVESTGSMTLDNNGELRGTASVNYKIPGCTSSTSAIVQGFPR